MPPCGRVLYRIDIIARLFGVRKSPGLTWDARCCMTQRQPAGLCTVSRGLQPGGVRSAATGRRRAEALGYRYEGHLRGLFANRASQLHA